MLHEHAESHNYLSQCQSVNYGMLALLIIHGLTDERRSVSVRNFYLSTGLMNAGIAHRNYGHGAAMAFATYSNPVFLEYAKQVWWAVKTYTLSQSELDAGTAPLKNISLTPTCQGRK